MQLDESQKQRIMSSQHTLLDLLCTVCVCFRLRSCSWEAHKYCSDTSNGSHMRQNATVVTTTFAKHKLDIHRVATATCHAGALLSKLCIL